MALPVTISGVVVGTQNSYHGPYKSATGGSFYTILRDSGDGKFVEAWKATDPTSSFTEQDSGNQPNFNRTGPLWSYQVGDNLHVVGQGWESAINSRVFYARFLTNDGSGDADTWVLIDGANQEIEIENTFLAHTAAACTIAVRSDGDIIVAYQGDTAMIMGSEFERIVWNFSTDAGINWNGPITLANGTGEVNYTGCVMVPGKDDRMHVFFTENTKNVYQRTIRSNDSLETFPSAFDTDASTNP